MFNKAISEARGGFFQHLSWAKAAQQSVTKFKAMVAINLVTSKAGAKRELFLNIKASVC
jgi:hypothetical protein